MVRNSLWPQFWLLRFFKVTIQLTQMFFDSPDLHVPVLPEIEGMCDSHEPATRQMQCWQIPPLQFLAAHPGLQCIAWGKALSRTVILGQALTVGTDLVSQMTVQNKPCSHESLSMPMSPAYDSIPMRTQPTKIESRSARLALYKLNLAAQLVRT
jgi:hypothetical protein